MKLLMIFITLFVYSFSNAQFIKEIYKSEIRVESSGIGTYNINILILNDDETFELQWQTYSTKKMAKNNVILSVITRMGKWEKKNNILTLYPETNDEIIHFSIKKNKIAKIIEQSQVSSLNWKKVTR